MAVAIDPVCLMEVDTDNPPGGHSEYRGMDYYFCGPGCKVAFDRDRSTCFPARAWCPWSMASTGMRRRGPPAAAESWAGCGALRGQEPLGLMSQPRMMGRCCP